MGGANPSLSTLGIDCVQGGRWGWGGGVEVSHSGERQGRPFDSQHMASRGGTVMRGHRQLVGALGCIWGLDEGNQGVAWIKKKVGVSKSHPPPPTNSLSLSGRAIHHRRSFVVSITVAS